MPVLASSPARRAGFVASLAFLVGLAAGLLPSGRVAEACSCMPPPPPAQALEEAAAVFEGRVLRIHRRAGAPLGEDFEVTFEVYARWKGPAGDTMTVRTGGNDGMCGYGFMLGEHYIVYAQGDESQGYWTGICSRTRLYDPEEAEALGPAEPVQPFVEPPGVGCPRCAAPPPPGQARDEAAAVFHGHARDLELIGPSGAWRLRATFDVVTWWKGGDAASVVVEADRSYWRCAGLPFFGFDAGDGFLLYAQRETEDGPLVLRICDRGGPYTEEEARALGPGQTALPPTLTPLPTPTGSRVTPPAFPTATPTPGPTVTPPIGPPMRTATPGNTPSSLPPTATPPGGEGKDGRVFLPCALRFTGEG